jgi:ATP-binding cassette subfamily F protein 3
MNGEVQRQRYLRVGYFAQHQLEQLDAGASALTHLQRQAPHESEQALRDFLGGFDFHGDKALDPIAPFSGGEKARLALALIVHTRPNLLLLDEPTNHLDLDMRHALEIALGGYAGAVVLVAHDRHLIDATCDRLWHLHDGTLAPFDGDLDDYARWISRQHAAREGSNPAEKTAASARNADNRRAAAARREREKPLRRALHKAEREMEQLDRKIKAAEAEMARPEIYNDPAQSSRLARQTGQLRKKLDAAEAQWLEHAEALETTRTETA